MAADSRCPSTYRVGAKYLRERRISRLGISLSARRCGVARCPHQSFHAARANSLATFGILLKLGSSSRRPAPCERPGALDSSLSAAQAVYSGSTAAPFSGRGRPHTSSLNSSCNTFRLPGSVSVLSTSLKWATLAALMNLLRLSSMSMGASEATQPETAKTHFGFALK